MLLMLDYRFPKVMYSLEGKRASDTLWEETLADLNWVGVRGILSAMGKSNA